MDDAALVFRFGECRGGCFLYSAKAIRANDQNILHPMVFQFVQHGQPVLGASVIPHMDGQHVFSPSV